MAAALVVLLAGCDWPMFGYGPDSSRSSPDTTITTGNVASLRLKFNWTPTAVPAGCVVYNVWTPVVAGATAYVEFTLAALQPFDDHCSGGIAAFNAATGATRWTHITGNGATWCWCVLTPTVVNGIVYATAQDGHVYALNAATGAVVWSDSMLASPPTVKDGIVYVDTESGVVALNGSTGAVMWTASAASFYISPPAVVGGVVYVGPLEEHTLYAFNAWNGAVVWTAADSTLFPTQTPPAVSNGIAYVSSDYSRLDAFDAATGAIVWTASTSGTFTYGAAVANGIVYTGSTGGPLIAFNAVTGALVWTSSLGYHIPSGTPAVANGIVYIGSHDDPSSITVTVHALDATTGAGLWSATAGTLQSGSWYFSSPVTANGIVYIGSADNVFAFGLP